MTAVNDQVQVDSGIEGDNNGGNKGEPEKYVKSASGVTARAQDKICSPIAETHSPEVANHDVALQKPRPLCQSFWSTGRSTASCICTIQLIDLA